MAWDSHFKKLARFRERYGHVQLPAHYPPDPELPLWLATQRTRLAKLTRTLARRLWDLGVRFPGWESRWLFQFFKLADGLERFNDTNDLRIWEIDPSLRDWIARQRFLHGCRRLVPYRRKWLNEIGFIWNVDEAVWECRFADWQAYVRETGVACMPNASADRALAQWTRFQRLNRRRGKLTAERIRRLNKAGFPWNPKTDQWERHFRELERFHKKHGHTRVGEIEGRSDLAAWCWDQTRHFKKGEVSPKRVTRLNALEFVWNPRLDFFERMRQQLQQFHALNGHGRVPTNWPEEPRLAQWITRQRQARKKGLLSRKRIRELKGLFEWNPRGK